MKKIILNKNSLFYIGFVILLYRYVFYSTEYMPSDVVITVMTYCGIILLFIKAIFTSFRKKYVLVIGAVTLFTLFLSIRDNDFIPLILLLIALSIKDTDLKIILKIWVYTYLLLLIFTIIRSITSGQYISMYAQFRDGVGAQLRYTLGFRHPNSLQGCVLRISAGLILLYPNILTYLILFFLNFLFFILTDSRAGFISFLILLFGVAISWRKSNKKEKKKTRIDLKQYIPSMLSMIYIYGDVIATYFYGDNEFIIIISALTSGRIMLANRLMKIIPVTLFGLDLDPFLSDGIVLDNGIVNAFLHYGVIAFILISIIYFYIILETVKIHRYRDLFVIVSMLLYCLIEAIYIQPFYNIAVLIVLYYFTNENNFIFSKKL